MKELPVNGEKITVGNLTVSREAIGVSFFVEVGGEWIEAWLPNENAVHVANWILNRGSLEADQ